MEKNSIDTSMAGMMKLAYMYSQDFLASDGFRPIFLFVQDSKFVRCVVQRPAEENELFLDTVRHVAIAKNATMGVFVVLLEGRSPDSNEVRNCVALAFQSRTEVVTLYFRVHRKADGTFSHLDSRGEQGENVPWLANIVPNKKPERAERLAAKQVMNDRKVKLAI